MNEEKIPHVIYLPLSQGKWAMVDSDAPEEIWGRKWFLNEANSGVGYAFAHAGEGIFKLALHREVSGASLGVHVHHKDGDGLNNLRENLRFATPLQNSQGHRVKNKRRGCSSGFRGISWYAERSKWCAFITVNGNRKNLGRFDSELEAADAYDAAARKYFGEFASPNFP